HLCDPGPQPCCWREVTQAHHRPHSLTHASKMAIQFRSLFPLALPGMLALLGWWWFFSHKKERLNSNDKQAKALMASPAVKDPIPKEEACPGVVSFPSSVTQLPEKEELSVGKPSTEPPALPWMRSESSGSLSIITDTGLQPGPCRDDSTKVELSLMGDEAKCIPLECPLPPKDVPSPHEAVEMYKQESALGKMPRGRWPGQERERERERAPASGVGLRLHGQYEILGPGQDTPQVFSIYVILGGFLSLSGLISPPVTMSECKYLEHNSDHVRAFGIPRLPFFPWKHLVGRLIGKQGRYVSFLKQTSGAKIYISTLPYTQNIQICHIEGSQHHVDKALNLIGKKFKELNLTNIYAPPLPSLALPSLPMTSWLMLPDGITVEVIVVNQVNAGHLFVQQHTHPTFHALRSLDQQMYLCYSQPGIPTLPTPVEITVICAAPGVDGAWWRAQVVASYEETNEVEIRYVDYGGYKRVKVDVLRQIRSDFVTLPFQGAEVLLDSVVPLSDDDHFSPEANAAMSEMTGNTALLAQVTSYSATGLPLIQLWSVVGDEVVLLNQSLVERGLAQWVDSFYASL
uniref:Tudor domain-containing protein n=1 Tax=Nannospalax galili TaxID=1026970 RepID=A0A8C6R3G4_NANGA